MAGPSIATANLFSRKTRTFVTVFGIGLSVSLLLVMAGMVNGNIRGLADRIAYIGADIMFSKNSFGLLYPDEMFSAKAGEKLLQVPGVQCVAGVVVESSSTMRFRDEEFRPFSYIYGIDYEEFNRVGAGFQFIEGGPIERDFDLIVDRRLAATSGLKVGDKVQMLGQEWTVSGVIKEALGARLFVDRDTLIRIAKPGNEGKVTLFFVRVENRDRTAEVVERLKNEFNQYGEKYAVRDINEIFSAFISIAPFLREFTIALTGICAVICFAVILLSMYNSIIERTREIGILKSLGATRGFIFKEILKEALILTCVGIVVGYLMTLSSVFLIKWLFPLLDMEMTPDWMLYSAAIAGIAALLGTLYPASRAIRLDPVVALSFE